MLKKVFSVLLAVSFFSVFFVPHASALTIIPPSMELQVVPGKNYETAVKLFNEEQDPKTLYTEVAPFTAEGETGNPNFDFNAPATGLSAWIGVQQGPITVEPGQRVEIPVTVAVPEDAEPGGHYAAVFFSSTPPAGTGENSQVAIGTKLGTLILARVEGKVVEAGRLQEFGFEGGGTLTRLPAEFFTRFTNTGNVHLRPSGSIVITNLFGGEAATLTVNKASGATLPGSTRKYNTRWEKAPVDDTSGNIWTNFWTEFANEKDNFALGRYTATLTLTAGQSRQISDTATMTFWVLPWRILLLSALAFAVLVLFIIFLIRRYNRWIIRRAAAGDTE